MPIQASDINNIQLYKRPDDAQAMDLCRNHRRTLNHDLAPDFQSLIATQFFQEHFQEFVLPDGADVNIRITDHTITVKSATRSKTIDTDALSNADDAEDINDRILRKAHTVYQSCLSESPTRTDAEEIDRLSRRTERVASQIDTTSQFAEKLTQLENQLQRMESRFGIPPLQPSQQTPQARIESIIQRLQRLEETVQNRPVARTPQIAVPTISSQDFTTLNDLSNALASPACKDLPTLDTAQLTKFNESSVEARNAVYYQTYLLNDPELVPASSRWPMGEKLFLGTAVNNQCRASAIRHVLLHTLATDLAGQPGSRPSFELFERFHLLSEPEKNAIYAQAQYLLYRTGSEDNPRYAKEAFLNQNGRSTTNALRSEAVHRALSELIVSHYRTQIEATTNTLHTAEQKLQRANLAKELAVHSLDALQRSHSEKMQQAQEKIDDLVRTKGQLESKLFLAQLAMRKKESDLTQAQKENEALRARVEDLLNNQQPADQINQLKTELELSKQKSIQLASQLQALLADKKAVEGDLEQLKNAINAQKLQVSALQSTNTKLMDELSKYQDLQKQLGAAQAKIDQLEASKAVLQKTIAQEHQRTDTLSSEFAKEREEMLNGQKKLEQQIQKLKLDLSQKAKAIEEFELAAQDNLERVKEAEERSVRLRQELAEISKSEENIATQRSIESVSPSEVISNSNSSELENTQIELTNLADALASIGGIGISINNPLKKKIFAINRDLLRIKEISFEPKSKTLSAQLSDQSVTLKPNEKKRLGDPLLHQLEELRESIAKSNTHQKIRTIGDHFKHLHKFCADFKNVSSQFLKQIDLFKMELAKVLSAHKNLDQDTLLKMIRGEAPTSIDLTPAKKAYKAIRTFCENQFLPLLDGVPARVLLTIEQLAQLNENNVSAVSTYPTKLKEDLSSFKSSFSTLLTVISLT